jgi:predicted nuclease with TOPRIM domain
VSEVVGAAQQNFKREEGPRAEPAELREELLDELKSMGSERKELEEKLAELRVREFCLLDRLTELNNQEELV